MLIWNVLTYLNVLQVDNDVSKLQCIIADHDSSEISYFNNEDIIQHLAFDLRTYIRWSYLRL